MIKTVVCTIVFSLTAVAQDWVPKKIVAISDYVTLGRQARIAGDVVIKCFLNSAGSVMSAEVVSGHKILKEQARQNALLWKFQRSSTQLAADFVLLKYQYRLEGEPQYRDGRTAFVVDLPYTIQIIAPVDFVEP